MRLDPIVDWIGNTPIEHGERGHELDAENPYACLCGEYDDYLMCPGEGIGTLTVRVDDAGGIGVERDWWPA